MSSRKDYEMAFRLSADVNGFTSGFSKASQTLVQIQGKIQELNRAQSDISAYQKQQRAVDATTDRLSLYQKQLENIQTEIRKQEAVNGSASSDLLNKELAKQAQIDKTTASLQAQTGKMDAMAERMRAAGVDMDDLGASSRRLSDEIDGLKREQEQAADAAEDFGESGSSGIEAVSSALAAAGIATALREIADAYMQCIEAAGGFEETLSTVEALSGATGDEMSALSAEAKRLGAETQFTAQESAEAMTYMGMAGWDASEMISGMSGVMDLAAASGEDLAQVSDIVTDNLTAFGLTASDTAHFSDVLAAAATNSNTSVATMGETFKYCAALAGTLDYSIEDVAVAVGLMANAGIKSSNAGTALRSVFTNLIDGCTLTSDAFGEVEFSAMNSDGTMKSFSQTLDELRGYFGQMSEAEQLMNAKTLAGQRAMSGFVSIMNSTEGDFASLTEEINDCSGAASKMASIKMDNMNGQLKLAQSAWEGVTIAIGEEFTPAMGKVYGALADVGGELKDFVEEHPAVVKGVTAIVGVLGAATAGMAALTVATKAFQALNLASVFTGPVGAILGVTSAVIGLATAASELSPNLEADVETVDELTASSQGLDDALAEAEASYQETAAATQANCELAEMYISRLEEIEAQTGGNVAGNQEYSDILSILKSQFPEVAAGIDAETASIEGGTAALREHLAAYKEDAEAQARQDYLSGLYSAYADAQAEVAENELKLETSKLKEEDATKKLAKAQEEMQEIWDDPTLEELPQRYYDLQNAAAEYEDEIYAEQKQQEYLNEALEEGRAKLKDAEEDMDYAAEAADSLSESTEGLTAEEQEASNAIGEMNNAIDGLIAGYNEAYEAALESFTGQFGLFDEASTSSEEYLGATVANAQAALDSQKAYWEEYNANLQALTAYGETLTGEARQDYETLLAYASDGSEQAAGLAASMADAISSGNSEAVAQMATTVGEVSDLQGEAADELAEWQTGFSEELAETVQETSDAIMQMDKSAEAQAAAANTMNSYITEVDTKSAILLQKLNDLNAQIATALTVSATVTAPTPAYGGVAGTGGGTSGAGEAGVGHAAGGFVSGGPVLSWLAEEGYGEYVIPTNPARRGDAIKLYEEAGEALGVSEFAAGGYAGQKRPVAASAGTSPVNPQADMATYVQALQEMQAAYLVLQAYAGAGDGGQTLVESTVAEPYAVAEPFAVTEPYIMAEPARNQGSVALAAPYGFTQPGTTEPVATSYPQAGLAGEASVLATQAGVPYLPEQATQAQEAVSLPEISLPALPEIPQSAGMATAQEALAAPAVLASLPMASPELPSPDAYAALMASTGEGYPDAERITSTESMAEYIQTATGQTAYNSQASYYAPSEAQAFYYSQASYPQAGVAEFTGMAAQGIQMPEASLPEIPAAEFSSPFLEVLQAAAPSAYPGIMPGFPAKQAEPAGLAMAGASGGIQAELAGAAFPASSPAVAQAGWMPAASDGGSYSYSYSPTINVNGGGDYSSVNAALADSEDRFRRWMEKYERNKKRLSYG